MDELREEAARAGARPLLEAEEVRIYFDSEEGPVRAVDGLSFTIEEGETAALVGESGCGKSVAALALARLVPPPGRYVGGAVRYRGRDVWKLSERALRALRGGEIAYIFQEPSTSLNPVFRAGYQVAEAIRLHRRGVDARREALAMLRRVGLPDPEAAYRAYPHQLSGGMQQRVMIAMALACQPRLLVADEPTTALDVTIQAQILELLRQLQAELGMAILLITHNLGLVAGMAKNVHIMYAGQLVESGPTTEVLRRPAHPYTLGLRQAVPRLEGGRGKLQGIEGSVPHPARLPTGCRFHPRCRFRQAVCAVEEPVSEIVDGRRVRCHFWREVLGESPASGVAGRMGSR